MEILDVAADGGGYVLTFEDDYQIALTMNPDGTMEWYSAVSGQLHLPSAALRLHFPAAAR